MRAIRIYQAGDYQTGQFLELTPFAAHHVAVVLRLQSHDKIILFKGDNREYEATIEAITKKKVVVLIGQSYEKNRESPLNIHLAQALSKGERMDMVMQKSVELGVASITPIITQHCAVRLDKEKLAKKLQQWQAIIIAACEQSGRTKIPIVHGPQSFEQYIESNNQPLKLLLHPDCDNRLKDYVIQSCEIALMVGPEGGFSRDEIQLSHQKGFLPWSLGPRILRTETATITALSLLQAVVGDL